MPDIRKSRILEISDSVVIAVDPQTAYERVSDVTQMGRWSPENTGAVLADPGAPVSAGARFVGSNVRRGFRWRTGCVVTAAEPGRRFAFAVREFGIGKPLLPVSIATWEYRFEPVDGGTRVTEIWHDDRTGWPDAAASVFDRLATGGRGGFAEFQRGNIRRTLDRLKSELEAEAKTA
ncbi:SRPBCC family protein [Nocardia higoensis]|uniref:SRPBCC family protein n=1 Tax=Nocardia higoensis TaxID=228599 RepID=UPI002B4B951D|nr:SRPBCC family protein [Nocardia higoensis]